MLSCVIDAHALWCTLVLTRLPLYPSPCVPPAERDIKQPTSQITIPPIPPIPQMPPMPPMPPMPWKRDKEPATATGGATYQQANQSDTDSLVSAVGSEIAGYAQSASSTVSDWFGEFASRLSLFLSLHRRCYVDVLCIFDDAPILSHQSRSCTCLLSLSLSLFSISIIILGRCRKYTYLLSCL